jgi:hypothetical protein
VARSELLEDLVLGARHLDLVAALAQEGGQFGRLTALALHQQHGHGHLAQQRVRSHARSRRLAPVAPLGAAHEHRGRQALGPPFALLAHYVLRDEPRAALLAPVRALLRERLRRADRMPESHERLDRDRPRQNVGRTSLDERDCVRRLNGEGAEHDERHFAQCRHVSNPRKQS